MVRNNKLLVDWVLNPVTRSTISKEDSLPSFRQQLVVITSFLRNINVGNTAKYLPGGDLWLTFMPGFIWSFSKLRGPSPISCKY
jgi:hypothetical protein